MWPRTPEAEADHRERRATLDRIDMLINHGLVSAYQLGAFTLEDFCRYVLSVAQKAHPADRRQADAYVAEALRKALSKPVQRPRGRPSASPWFDALCVDLAQLVSEKENLPFTIDGAFTRVAEIFHDRGIMHITPNTVDRACVPRSRSQQIK